MKSLQIRIISQFIQNEKKTQNTQLLRAAKQTIHNSISYISPLIQLWPIQHLHNLPAQSKRSYPLIIITDDTVTAINGTSTAVILPTIAILVAADSIVTVVVMTHGEKHADFDALSHGRHGAAQQKRSALVMLASEGEGVVYEGR